MSISINDISDPSISCNNCKACCCRLEVMLITETGVPEAFIDEDAWGGQVMKRLEDGYCAALNRKNFMCSIYENRPWICREFAAGSYECQIERETLVVQSLDRDSSS